MAERLRQVLIKVSPDLRRRIKMEAVRKDITVRKLMIEMINKMLEEEGK